MTTLQTILCIFAVFCTFSQAFGGILDEIQDYRPNQGSCHGPFGKTCNTCYYGITGSMVGIGSAGIEKETNCSIGRCLTMEVGLAFGIGPISIRGCDSLGIERPATKRRMEWEIAHDTDGLATLLHSSSCVGDLCNSEDKLHNQQQQQQDGKAISCPFQFNATEDAAAGLLKLLDLDLIVRPPRFASANAQRNPQAHASLRAFIKVEPTEVQCFAGTTQCMQALCSDSDGKPGTVSAMGCAMPKMDEKTTCEVLAKLCTSIGGHLERCSLYAPVKKSVVSRVSTPSLENIESENVLALKAADKSALYPNPTETPAPRGSNVVFMENVDTAIVEG